MKILITGANGFVGLALCERALADGWRVRGTVRSVKQAADLPDGVDAVKIESIGSDTDWSKVLSGVGAIVHLAARVHVMDDTVFDPLSAFRQVNVGGTARLARMAAKAGVRRFVYLSSIKVNGEGTGLRSKSLGQQAAGDRQSISENDVPDPQDPYGVSKLEAEQVLNDIAAETGIEVVILRPPLVYGPGVKANFRRLLKLTKVGLPLPLSSIHNQRSMIYVGNLVDAIVTCLEHSKAAGETFLVSDGEDVSTPELIRMIASAMGRKPRLLPIAPALLNILGKVTGKSAEVERLTGFLCVDSSKTRRILDWEPPFTMEEGIRQTVEWFMTEA